MQLKNLFAVVAVTTLGACVSQPALLFEGMGEHSRKVSTRDPRAQRYFDQGLALSYGFNHDEAVRSFAEAARIDPDCAMAWWGQAYALGPNINLPLDEEHGEKAYAAIQRALASRNNATAVEQDLIDALATRYENPPPGDRVRLDKAYARAMGELWKKYPQDDDIGFLYADALMNLSPWDQWAKDGTPKPNTLEIVATLERVLQINVNHPGANHMYIHAIEASPNPGKAEAAADRLGRLSPGIGHMVHMPSHIYVQVGRFKDSVECNKKASQLDREYFAKVGTQGIYHTYHAHNNHFVVWSAMFLGRYEEALRGCRDLINDMPPAFRSDPGVAEWLVMDVHVHIRFGRWEAVLQTPCPRQDQPYAVAMWHYARGVAFANTQRIAQARAEAAAFEKVAATVPADQVVFIVPAHDVLRVAREMLAGETAFKAGQHDLAFKHLRAAVVAEDALRYSEPSPWMMPTRHALGALLLEQGQVAEAEMCYRQDLTHYPENGWSLNGLAECLERRNAVAEAAAVRKRFGTAWADATVSIKASCFCRTNE
ncbi:MAG: tetratricopeptide repeat protein [Planctomycetota bacterium]|jgi:tetratricopeptide (TPR) repeat protein